MEDILYKQTTKVENFLKLLQFPDKMPSDILKKKKLSIGFDPNLFTKKIIKYFFGKNKL